MIVLVVGLALSLHICHMKQHAKIVLQSKNVLSKMNKVTWLLQVAMYSG